MEDPTQSKWDVKIQTSKLNLKEGQMVKATQDMLDKLPLNKYTPTATVKEENPSDIDQDSQSSTSTILYSWTDKPTLQVSQIPEHYLKPKFKLPDSLKLPKPKESARFKVQPHGIKKCKPKHWFKCLVSNCRHSFPTIHMWNTHHTVAHKNIALICNICQ